MRQSLFCMYSAPKQRDLVCINLVEEMKRNTTNVKFGPGETLSGSHTDLPAVKRDMWRDWRRSGDKSTFFNFITFINISDNYKNSSRSSKPNCQLSVSGVTNF